MRKMTKRFGWHGLLVLAIICLIVTQGTKTDLAPWHIRLTESPIGRMRVLCFGILAARYPIRLNYYVAAGALAFVILGNAYLPMAPLASIAAAVFAIWAYTKMRGALRSSRFLEIMGNYSLAIFLLNGIVRAPFIPFATTPSRQLLLAGISFFITMGVSVILQDFVPSGTPTKSPKPSHSDQSTDAVTPGAEPAR